MQLASALCAYAGYEQVDLQVRLVTALSLRSTAMLQLAAASEQAQHSSVDLQETGG